MSQDKEREAFEAYYSENGKWPAAIQRKGGSYLLSSAESAWTVWQARAALATQPPAVQGEPLTPDAIEKGFSASLGKNYYDFVDGVRFAEAAHGIHSRGEGEKA